jgi:hypothetical protein
MLKYSDTDDQYVWQQNEELRNTVTVNKNLNEGVVSLVCLVEIFGDFVKYSIDLGE